MSSSSDDDSDTGVQDAVTVNDFVDVEAEHDSESDSDEELLAAAIDDDLIREWIISDSGQSFPCRICFYVLTSVFSACDLVDPSIHESDTLSESDDFPSTLTGYVCMNHMLLYGILTRFLSALVHAGSAIADVRAQEAAGEPLIIGKIDVKGKSVELPVQISDNLDVPMSDTGENSTYPVDVHQLSSDHVQSHRTRM